MQNRRSTSTRRK